MYLSAILQVEKINSVATKYKMKDARRTERAAPNSESISLKGGTKSIFRKSDPTLPSKNSPKDAPINTASNAKTTFWL